MRLLIVDDHEVVRRGVRSLLVDEPNYEVCGEAVDGQDAVYKARELKPDLIIMDVSMPKLNGLEATRLIRSILPEYEVLILTQHEPGEMARQAFKVGARGYVLKGSISRDLAAALEKISHHEYFFDQSIARLSNTPAQLDVQEILQRSAAFEQALRNSEELYRSTFELAGVGVAHVSPEGRWLRVNQKICEILGYSEAELLKQTFQEVTHPDDLKADLRETDKIRNRELERFSMEKRYIRKNGAPIWVNLVVRGVYDANGKLTHFISVIEDITECREADEARARLAAILQSSDDAIVSKNLDGIITSWNAAATRIFGYLPEEAIGKSITLIIPPELQDEEKQILKRLRAGERIEHFETVRVSKSGKKLDLSLTISPVRDSKGRIIGASKVARDITDRKRIEQALRDGQAQLSLALESSRTAMFDWDVVGKRGSWNDQLAAIYDFNPQDQHITDAEWNNLFHPEDRLRLAEEHIDVELELPSDLGRLPQDMEMTIFRIIQECLSNILRHSGSGKATIRIARSMDHMDVEVRDYGKGMAVRANGSSTPKPGVGIQGMRERVRQFSGDLDIQSSATGTTVIARLPITVPSLIPA